MIKYVKYPLFKIGDQVVIAESRPYSKDKHYRVEAILNRAAQIDRAPLTAPADEA